MNLGDTLLTSAFDALAAVHGQTVTYTGGSVSAVIDPQPIIDGDFLQDADVREVCKMEIKRSLDPVFTYAQTITAGGATYLVLKREDNGADVTVNYWIRKQ